VFVTHDQEEAMSICDIMVVMKLGVVQQIGEPQHIYDDPDNLFVANFLGTPPINIFTGEIKDHKVYINGEEIMDTEFNDQLVYVGIRPEGFIYNPNGKLSVNLDHIEVMGRDKTIISTNPASTKPSIRSIVDSDVLINTEDAVKFDLKPNKVFLFNRDTEMRIRENEEVVENTTLDDKEENEVEEINNPEVKPEEVIMDATLEDKKEETKEE
jgi:multiple sugar transport system ATP-binding protein